MKETAASSRRKSWSARFSARDVSIIERGSALTHCGAASRFVQRAFLDYAAERGSLRVLGKAPAVVERSKKGTLANIVEVQDALVARLTHGDPERGVPSTLIARRSTLTWLSQYLIAGTARPQTLQASALAGPLPMPLNLRLQADHLEVLAAMAGDELDKSEVLSAALHAQAQNIGLEDSRDEFGLPCRWDHYPHPELLKATNTIEDTLIALVIAYRSLETIKPTMDWVRSSTALMSEIPHIKPARAGTSS